MAESAPHIETYEGNTVAIPFRLRRKTIKGYWNVSTATAIRMELVDPTGANKPAITADEAHPHAKWDEGLVIVVISSANVTAQIGSWHYALTVEIDSQIITVDDGTIEVFDRPGFTLP